jgi:ArsR family metal-binding transcriptional regulator
MLVNGYELEVFTPPCSPGSVRFAARAQLDANISAVMPYLNAVLEGAKYNPAAGALGWRKADHNVVFQAHEIAVGNLADRDAARAEVDELIAIVNQIWGRRDEIVPSHRPHVRLTVMSVYKLLPQTNCRACAQPSCWGFAVKLVAGQENADRCSVLEDAGYERQRRELTEMLAAAG